MTTITVKLVNEKDVELLKSILQNTYFEDEVEVVEEIEDDELSDEELLLLNERIAEYERNPASGKSWEEVKQDLKKRYGI